jgi:hypothetical protein
MAEFARVSTNILDCRPSLSLMRASVVPTQNNYPSAGQRGCPISKYVSGVGTHKNLAYGIGMGPEIKSDYAGKGQQQIAACLCPVSHELVVNYL